MALDVPLDRLFDYRNIDATAADIGRRVQVPFGRTRTTGIIAALSDSTDLPAGQLKAIGGIDRTLLPIPPDVFDTLRFASGYYQHPFGAALFAALPPAVPAAALAREPRPEAWSLTDEGRARQSAWQGRPAPKQQALLDRLAGAPAVTEAQLHPAEGRDPGIAALLRRFRTMGWVVPASDVAQHPGEDPAADGGADTGFSLNAGQQATVDSLREGLGRFGVHLLFGVTGSGKTTVYARTMEQALARGHQVLMLVPEINLTPQLDAALRSDLPGASFVVLHSGLPAAERARRWLAAASGLADVVVGTRLAAFTPMPRLGLVVVDEEHDASFKQEEGLRYHARDVLVWRARARDVPVVLGSATPVLETLHNAQSGRYRMLRLDVRPTGPMPAIDIIDLRRYPRIAAHKPEPSEPLLKALAAQIERGEQGLVLLNRRGYSPALRCNGCGWVAGCPRCSARFVLHQRQHTLRCHHCGQAERPPRACPTCGNPDLTALGLGTERLEETLARLLPGARILRIDRDTVRTAAAWEQARERIRRREVDLLVGTQMLAKGHDFPRLTLVGVVDSDQALYSSDFRAPERLFALLTQVAGRAGRADLPGRVMIETSIPQHPLFGALARHDYSTFAGQLLDERRQMRLPPFSSQAILRADAAVLAEAIEFLAAAAALAPGVDPSITVYDPVPALLVRRAGRERAQLLVQSASRGRFQRFLGSWRQAIAAQRQSKVHWILDVDPLEL
ncbi:MAG: primosomal protein N' [Burkholderiales bacterium]|nr:primosomal protein N' [Burkholderiales bacterium]